MVAAKYGVTLVETAIDLGISDAVEQWATDPCPGGDQLQATKDSGVTVRPDTPIT